MKIVVVSLILFSVLSVDSVAQEYTRWGLPDGAKMRLGKGTVVKFEYSPDGTRLAVATTIGVWLYDTVTYKPVALLNSHTAATSNIAFNTDGSVLISWDSGGYARQWDVKLGRHLRTFGVRTSPYGRSAFSADGGILVFRSYDALMWWDFQSGIRRMLYRLVGRSIKSLAVSPDGSLVATGSEGGTVSLWDVKADAELHMLTGHTDAVTSVAFSPDGRTLASGEGAKDGTLRLWNVKTGEHLKTFTRHASTVPGAVRVATFSPDGRMIAIGWSNLEIQLWGPQKAQT